MANQPAPAAPAPGTSALVGREREQAALRAALDAALAGRGALVLIGGEAGIGKTALAEAICTEAVGRGALALVGRCYDLSETPPYGPWREVFARVPGAAGLPTLPAAVLPVDRAGAALGGQEAIVARVRAYLAALAARQPLVLLLDDLHWADPASLDLLRVVARSAPERPLLVLATYRDDELTHRHPLSPLLPALVREARAERLTLRPLAIADLCALIRARYALSQPDEERLVAFLAGRSEGNPLYAGEILRALEEVDLLRRDATGAGLGDLAAAGVPPLLRQVIDARVARLGAGARDLLMVAAVLGQEVPLALWAAVGEAGEDTLLTVAERAIAARLLAASGGRAVRFAHALIREALYAGIPALRQRATHRRAAEALIAGPLPDPDAVVSHLGRAADPREYDWLVRAGERALARSVPQAALDRLTRALDLASRLGIGPGSEPYRLRGLARETLGDFAGALVDHEAALAAARAAGDGRAEWRVQIDLGQLWSSRDYGRVGEHYDRALALARGLDDPAAIADSLNRLGNWQLNIGRPWDGIALHREALALLEALGDRRGMANTHDLVGMAQWIGLGQAIPAVHDFGQAAELLRVLDAPQQLSSCLATRCVAASPIFTETVGGAHWQAAACLRDADEAEQLAEAADWAAGRAYANLHAGLVLTGFGIWGRALERLDRAFDLAAAIDHRQWLAGVGCARGQLHVLLLAPGEARVHLDAALALARELNSAWWTAGATTYLALAHLQSGDHDAAEAALGALLAAAPLATAAPRTLPERRLAWAWAEVRLAQGRAAEALAIVDALLATAPGTGAIPALLIARGKALLALGRADEAALALDDAVRGAQARHERPRLWLAHAAHVALHRAHGRQADAEQAATAARAVVEELAATLPDGELREGFRRRADAQLRAPARATDTAARDAALPFGLSAREAEVLALVARGLTNAQAAARLFVTPRTVGAHLTGIYTKLNVDNRAAAIRVALDHGLA